MDTPHAAIDRSDAAPDAAPVRSGATRLAVAWSILLGVGFLSLGLTDVAAGLTSSSRRVIDVGGLVEARVAQTVSGGVVTFLSTLHLVVTVGVWRLRPGARDALLTMAVAWSGGAVLVGVLQLTAGLGQRAWLSLGVAVLNLTLVVLLLQPAHRVDLERADAGRRRALI